MNHAVDDLRRDVPAEACVKAWRDLLEADRDRNVGMPLDLISAEGYAEQEGVTRAQYIIRVLRAERDRRSALDSIACDRMLLDEVIDEARKKGVPVPAMLAERFGTKEAEISSHFMVKLVTRMQERMK